MLIFALLPILFSALVLSDDTPSVSVGNGQITWVLLPSNAQQGFDFFQKEPTCSANGAPQRRADPHEVAQLVNEGISFMQQFGDYSSVANQFYAVAVTVADSLPLNNIPLLADDTQNAALAELIAWTSTHLGVQDLYFIDPFAIPIFSLLVLSSTVASCFNNKRTIDTLKKFSVNTKDGNFEPANYCPATWKPFCDYELCQGNSGVCTNDYMKGCSCQEPSNCPPPEVRPFCSGCGGADPNTGLCKGVTGKNGDQGIYQGCECDADVAPWFDQPWSSLQALQAVIDATQELLNGGHGDNPVQCNGVSSPTWSLEFDFVDAVNEFCENQSNLGGSPGEVNSIQMSDRIRLSLTFPQKCSPPFNRCFLDTATCKNGMMSSLTNCDGNDPANNPGNLKHGGKFTDQDYVYETIPLKAGDSGDFEKKCKEWSTGLYKGFVQRDLLNQNIQDICGDVELWANGGVEGTKIYQKNPGSDDAVTFTVSFAKLTTIPKQVCIDELMELSGGCNGNDPNNQFDFKWGGWKAKPDRYYEIAPTANRMPTTSGSGSGSLGHLPVKGTKGMNGKDIDKTVLQMCLAGYGYEEWDPFNCAGMVNFFKGHYTTWNSAADCHNGCKNLLSDLIDKGFSIGMCQNCVNGVAVCCWEGYDLGYS